MKTEIIEDYFSNVQNITQDNTQKEKIIVETKKEYNCEESIRKYYVEENNQRFLQKISNVNLGPMPYVAGANLLSFFGLGLLGIGYLVYQYKYKKEENKTQLEDYITFDKKIIIYNDGSTEIQKINIKNQTRIVPE